MSTRLQPARRRLRIHRRLDEGMTLPEVLISMVLMGTLLTALVAATTVVVRQQDNSRGRLNNSRSEQNVGIWLPSDLASAEDVDPLPTASPCGTACPPNVNVGGSNALMLSWTGSIANDFETVPTRTTVSYRYVEVDGEFQIIRVKCVTINGGPPTCDQVVVLHDVSPPPPGQTWDPPNTSPTWVFVVRLALNPLDTSDAPDDTAPADPSYYTKNGRRVTVTINGGGDVAGAGGGQDSVTLSAGGTDRKPDLSTSNFTQAPSFGATHSRCGGNFAMIVDTSGSIGSTNMNSVKAGITAFINSFAGTPIKLEIVKFASTASTLGAGALPGWSRYYDMLVETDVADLKTQVGTLVSNGATNWEDAMFRVFKNNDGTVQSTLPDTLIFFTDGMPSYTRLQASSSTYPAVADNDDAGLPTPTGNSYSQVGWNRAWRIARDYYADVDRFIGVFVGSDTSGTSTWRTQGAGYHFENFQRGYHQTWDRGYHLENFLRGYHQTYDRGYHLTNFQRGYHQTWDRGYRLTNFQRGYHLDYQRATTTTTGSVTYQRKSSGVWSNVPWDATSGSTSNRYARNNSNNTESDNYRVVISGTPTAWTPITTVNGKDPATLYSQSNVDAGETDGFRTVKNYSAPYDSYETVTDNAVITANNPSLPTLATGWTATTSYTSPFTYWASTTQTLYNSNNTTADASDGWRVNNVYTSPFSSWEATTEALYNASNTTADNTDGWTATNTYTAPFTLWESTTQALYDAGNTTADATDGWRANNLYSSPYSSWEATTEATYNSSNTTADNSDGWTATTTYTAPYTFWASTSQSAYNAGNTTPDALDGWRANNLYSSPYSQWETTTEALYNAGNTTADSSDGWTATKVYTQPYNFHESATSTNRANTAILGQIVSEGANVLAVPQGGPYTNAKDADLYVLPNWDQFAGALNAMALAECGGTVTVQTKVVTGTGALVSAPDPFTYLNSVDLTTATTSAIYRSGTFDFDLAGGVSVTADISPLNFNDLTRYEPVDWTCKSAGSNYPVVKTAMPSSTWSKITLTVSPNQAISCVQTVRLK